ncbi:MAG: hypothetical protein WBQ95_18465 [Terracidiphilus sp.]
MAHYDIYIPGNAGVDMQDQDTLTIHFNSRRKFCIVAGNSASFNPALPAGAVGEQGSKWDGTAIVSNASISYSHVDWDKGCGANPADSTPGTIKIGSGTK